MASPKASRSAVQTAATHLAALYDVEPFSGYELMHAPYSHRMLEVLVDIERYDELFSVPQCRHDVMHTLLHDLFSEFPNENETAGWSLPDALIFWELLVGMSKENAQSTFVKIDVFNAALQRRVGSQAAQALISAFVLTKPNSTFQLPADAHSADTRECAIATASETRFWIAPRPFLGPAFLSRLLSKLSEFDVDVSGRVGKSFELRMVARMEGLGISCRRGDLGRKGAKSGDSDLIIETDAVILLCEFKKKALTRLANSGNDLQLTADLARGLVTGVNQLAKQEIELRKTEKLRFTDGSELTRNDRRIVKIVISLSDHGGLHDASMVRHTLRVLQGASLTPRMAISAEQSELMAEVNLILGTLGRRSVEFSEIVDANKEGDLFDGLLFHNIFFIEQLLLRERTAEKFISALLLGMRVVTGTRDPFFDYEQFRPV
ncbi:hypothetical protein LJR029_005726 [Caballeronia sp. LjRoot29]|uniref:hypothetical protein n=1 Tax=Caballeronia sp. LjRoot29 TaxID=3342315 RepID=UPI003ECFE0EF